MMLQEDGKDFGINSGFNVLSFRPKHDIGPLASEGNGPNGFNGQTRLRARNNNYN